MTSSWQPSYDLSIFSSLAHVSLPSLLLLHPSDLSDILFWGLAKGVLEQACSRPQKQSFLPFPWSFLLFLSFPFFSSLASRVFGRAKGIPKLKKKREKL